MTRARHAHEEILVLTTASKFWLETLLYTLQNPTSKQKIAGAALLPLHDPPRLMFRPLEKPPVDNPARGRLLEMGPHRPQHASRLIFLARLEHRPQPTIFRKFIIVDECDEIARGMLQSLVTRQGNVLSRLTRVFHRDPTRCHELGDHPLRASSRIIIGDNDGERKSAVRLLLLQAFQQLPQQARPLKGTNADADVFLSSSHGSMRVRYAFIHWLIQRYPSQRVVTSQAYARQRLDIRIAHQERVLGWALRVHHEFHVRFPCKANHAFEPVWREIIRK